MKTLLIAFLISTTTFANIPQGSYLLDKIACSVGNKTLKLGGKFMVYTITLDVFESKMRMTAIAKNRPWAPFKLDCVQQNYGDYSIISNDTYEGNLPLESVKCNSSLWEKILRKNLFGVEEQSNFSYSYSDGKLVVQNPNSITKYSCADNGGHAIYYYTKK